MAAPAEARLPLSRERILAAALELVDDGGLEALSMRKLGQRLGYEAMSLYNHVRNKDDVIDGILDLVLAETEPPAPGGDWRSAVRRSAISVHDALGRHTWAAGLLMAAGHVRDARIDYMNRLLERLRTAGFSAETTYHAYHALDGHIFGFSMWQAGHAGLTRERLPSLVREFAERYRLDRWPYVLEHAEQHITEGPLHDVRAFDFTLDLILDGLARLHEAGAEPGA
jgi:AcrR family transcriptional regulator